MKVPLKLVFLTLFFIHPSVTLGHPSVTMGE